MYNQIFMTKIIYHYEYQDFIKIQTHSLLLHRIALGIFMRSLIMKGLI